MELKRVLNSGKSKIHGLEIGEKKDSSKSKEVLTNAESNQTQARHISEYSFNLIIYFILFIISKK
jgi:hypothetical protein